MRRAVLAAAALLAACEGPAARHGETVPEPVEGGEPAEAAPAAWVVVEEPGDGAALVAGLVTLRGTASPGTGRVDVSVDGGPSARTSGTDAWSVTLALGPGTRRLLVVASGPGGRAEVVHTLHVGHSVVLVAPGEDDGVVALRLDRFALERLVPLERQAELVLTRLDLTPLVTSALAALSDPEAWGVDTDAWGPAEHNLVRLLGMTPDTLDATGTALAPLLELSASLGLPPARILADLLDQAPTAPVLLPEDVAGALVAQVMASHPSWAGDEEGRMEVTLYDALRDLAPLGVRYGPVDGHPGFMDGPPRARLLTPDFAMVVRAASNVVVRPGLRPGSGYASYVSAPAGAPLLEIDFEDPEGFSLEGLEPEPTVTLGMRVVESPDHFELVPAEADPAPPRGRSAVWSAPPWTVEHVVAEAAWGALAGRFDGPRVLQYDLGAVSPAATLVWEDGLLAVDVAADLGPPPPTAWIWDLILDVAQARLHDGDLAEGEAVASLVLPELPVGMDAEALVAEMRPVLQEQAAELTAWMLGGADELESAATVWLEPDPPRLVVAPGEPLLFDGPELTGEGRAELPLGDAPQTAGPRGPGGPRAGRLVGAWAEDRVRVGVVEVPE